MKGAFISIRPRFVKQILSGVKTVELRRRAPACNPGDYVVIYETSPRKAIVGAAVVSQIHSEKTCALWKKVKGKVSVSRGEYHDYFRGSESACAIFLKDVISFGKPIDLADARELAPSFTPPQSWCYLERIPTELRKRIKRKLP